jgi:protein TonB
MPECDGCVPWGVDAMIPIEEPMAPEATPAKPVVRIGRGVEAPVKLRDVKPDYPGLALLTRVEGVVIVECRVDESGRVADARVLRGHPLLDAAALDAIRQWRYRPTLLNGNPVSVIMTVTVRFQLRR